MNPSTTGPFVVTRLTGSSVLAVGSSGYVLRLCNFTGDVRIDSSKHVPCTAGAEEEGVEGVEDERMMMVADAIVVGEKEEEEEEEENKVKSTQSQMNDGALVQPTQETIQQLSEPSQVVVAETEVQEEMTTTTTTQPDPPSQVDKQQPRPTTCTITSIPMHDNPTSSSSPSPSGVWGGSATFTKNNQIFLFGGETNTDEIIGEVTIITTEDDGKSITRERLPLANGEPRAWHTATYVPESNSLLIFGGINGKKQAVNDLQAFDCELLLWFPLAVSGKSPSPRQGHTSCMMNIGGHDVLFVHGGCRKSNWFGDSHFLNTSSWRWINVEVRGNAQPQPRSYHASCVVNNHVFLFGGNDAIRTYNDLWMMTTVDNQHVATWMEIDLSMPVPRPSPRLGLSMCPIPGHQQYIFVFGGWDTHVDSCAAVVQVFDDAWMFDVTNSCWIELDAHLGNHRTGYALAANDKHMFMMGGQGPPPQSERGNDVLLVGFHSNVVVPDHVQLVTPLKPAAAAPSSPTKATVKRCKKRSPLRQQTTMSLLDQERLVLKCMEVLEGSSIDETTTRAAVDAFLKSPHHDDVTIDVALPRVLDMIESPAFSAMKKKRGRMMASTTTHG